ncbi:MAG: Uma2 family endonuclease [Pleurocapsa minor GSE-CHR-MK-17-07R]|nr:Uma2 family endonuclease [Pleurocapsa minor GSE-CHR-MK 17-07R]
MVLAEQKRISYDEYVAFVNRPENADRLFELIEGKFVEKMASFSSSKVALRIGQKLLNYLDQNEIGFATAADGGYIMPDGNILMPDVGYISRERMPEPPVREVPMPPDLAVEVKSPTDSTWKLRAKVDKYLAHGTRLVWIIFPDEQRAEVYAADAEDLVAVGAEGVLDGGVVLPGFSLPMKDIFR